MAKSDSSSPPTQFPEFRDRVVDRAKEKMLQLGARAVFLGSEPIVSQSAPTISLSKSMLQPGDGDVIHFRYGRYSRCKCKCKESVAGPPGQHGVAGRDGRDGINGINGLNGHDGAAGINGLNGRDGAAGINGLNGRDGAPGQDGAAGEVGPAGQDGPAGNTNWWMIAASTVLHIGFMCFMSRRVNQNRHGNALGNETRQDIEPSVSGKKRGIRFQWQDPKSFTYWWTSS